jgi:hypothetical protein
MRSAALQRGCTASLQTGCGEGLQTLTRRKAALPVLFQLRIEAGCPTLRGPHGQVLVRGVDLRDVLVFVARVGANLMGS